MSLIYLDNNATTQPAQAVVEAMREAQQQLWANPSSVHRLGQKVRQRLELARDQVAQLIGAKARDLIFTSGGTEANNLALAGVLASPPAGLLVTTAVEHAAISEPAEAFAAVGGTVVYLEVDRHGRVEPQHLRTVLDEILQGEHRATVLVSIQWANNETGIIQPLGELARYVVQARQALRASASKTRLHLHVDATQAVGKLPVDVGEVGVDLLTLSGHKFHGPKGVGALWARNSVRLVPMQRGGPQERDKRGGTENSCAIIAMGVAADLAGKFLADQEQLTHLTQLRDRFEAGVIKALPQTHINPFGASTAPSVPRLWNTSNLGFPGLSAEAILIGLSERGLCASAGAACSSGSLDPSAVLLAMGVPEPIAHGSVRFSLSRLTTTQEIDQAIEMVAQVVTRVSQTMPAWSGE